MLIGDIMSKNVISVAPTDNTMHAAKLMSDHNIGAVPVVQDNQVKGMLTDRDIVLRCVAQGKDYKTVPVSDIMTSGAAFVSSSQPVSDAVELMSSEQVRRLPVVDNGKITGMLSLADIARLRNEPEIAKAISEISMP